MGLKVKLPTSVVVRNNTIQNLSFDDIFPSFSQTSEVAVVDGDDSLAAATFPKYCLTFPLER